MHSRINEKQEELSIIFNIIDRRSDTRNTRNTALPNLVSRMFSSTLIFDVGDATRVKNVIEKGYLEEFDDQKGWLVRDGCEESPSYHFVPPIILERATARECDHGKPFLVPNEYSATWKQPLSLTFECEVAKSSRVQCSECLMPIVKGEWKAGKKTIVYVYKNKSIATSVCWHHLQCFPILSSNFDLSDGGFDSVPCWFKSRIQEATEKWKRTKIEPFHERHISEPSRASEKANMTIGSDPLDFVVPAPVAAAARNAVARQVLAFKTRQFQDIEVFPMATYA